MIKYQNPNFDKALYKERREASRRGQIDIGVTVGVYASPKPVQPPTKKAMLKNTKRWRKLQLSYDNAQLITEGDDAK